MVDQNYSIYVHARDRNLRLIIGRDWDLPPDAVPEDWDVVTYVTGEQVGEAGLQQVKENGFWLYLAAPDGRECPTFPPPVS